MVDDKKCRFDTPDWMPQGFYEIFCKLAEIVPPYKYSADYKECRGAALSNECKDNFCQWQFDTEKYPFTYLIGHSRIWGDGKVLGGPKDLSDGRHIIAVKKVEMACNGDCEKSTSYCLGVGPNEEQFGNVYLFLTPGECKDYSPFVEINEGEEKFRDTIARFQDLQEKRFEEQREQLGGPEYISPSDVGLPPDLEDLREGFSAEAVLPGPYASHPPSKGDKDAQCEFGLQAQSTTYVPPKWVLDVDDERVPEKLRVENYCGRVLESDGGPAGLTDDTPILQFQLNLAELQAAGEEGLTFVHDASYLTSVRKYIGGAESIPSLFKLTLVWL